MTKYFLVVLGLLLFIGGLVFLSVTSHDNKTQEVVNATAEAFVTGVVMGVDRSQIMFDGPTLITVATEDGTTKTIAVPSMGINFCVASVASAAIGQLAEGDTVVVVASEDENGYLVPCAGEKDNLTIQGRVSDAAYGYEFAYRKSPDGYTSLEDTTSSHGDFVAGVVLYDAREYEQLLASEEAREAPPALRVRVYHNPEKLQASVWMLRHQEEVNYGLKLGEEEEVVVGGARAVRFHTDGLFTTDTYVVAHGQHVYVLMGDYFDAASPIRQDFKNLVASFTFIPVVENERPAAKLDPRAVCESALMYMTFASGEEADAFVARCVNGEHPEVFDQYIQNLGLDGAVI